MGTAGNETKQAARKQRSRDCRGTARSSTSPLQSGQPGERQPVPTFLARCTPSGSLRRSAVIRSSCSRSRRQTRVPELVPIRYGRMLVSPFTFYRGAAYLMAADLATRRAPGCRPALRRRAPLELRRLRSARPPARLQRERLRRDAARARSSGTSSDWLRASRSRGATGASTRSSARAVNLTVTRAYREAMRELRRRCATSTSGTPALDVEDDRAELPARGARAKQMKRSSGTSPRRGRRTA